MQITQTSAVPSASKKTLFAYFLTEENQQSTLDFIRENHGISFSQSEEYWEKGRTTLHHTEDLKIKMFGLGEKAPGQEKVRNAVHNTIAWANRNKMETVFLDFHGSTGYWASMAETARMSNYQFLVYKTEKKENSVKAVQIFGTGSGAADAIQKGTVYGEANTVARDLVNEPVITLTAEEIANRAVALGKQYGFKTEVFNKARIQSLKMGGLLAVNYGSPLPPTFTIMEWKPKAAKNAKPVILVGKGVVYDTGGLSLKPTANSMDLMKSDMAGAAAVIGAMCGIAALKLPVHVIGLVPATDNRPGQNAYTPGDVITMYDGTKVEVLNTDAEGRMILADALAYAKKYKPEFVIDLATLTGAAIVAVGHTGTLLMSTADEKYKQQLKAAGDAVYERLVELPLWEEFGEQLKSDIADMKNIGGKPAGSITAGKFLEHFTDYPWAHLDIAGPAFLQQGDSYRGKNGTGTGVRTLIHFIENYSG